MKPFLRFKKGGWFRDENAAEVVMGYEAAELEQREIGDFTMVPEKNVQLKVVGILERTGTQDDGTIFVPLKTLMRISGTDKITTIGIKLKKNADQTSLETKLGGHRGRGTSEWDIPGLESRQDTSFGIDKERGMSPNSGAALEARGLTRVYRRGSEEIRALDGVSLTIQRGEFVSFMG